MGIRETMNQNPAITTATTLVIILAAIGAIIWQATRPSPLAKSGLQLQVYFTVDDGVTYFADEVRNHPPYQKDGKTAYRCYVFTCDGGKTKFVSYLERFTPEAKQEMDEAAAANRPPDNFLMQSVAMSGTEVKPPRTGDQGWLLFSDMDMESTRVVSPRCPDGTTNDLEPVIP